MPKFISADLGVVQTTGFGQADTDPPFWQLQPVVSALEHNRIEVTATGHDNQSAFVSYSLAWFGDGGFPSATDLQNGMQGDGVTPLLRLIEEQNVPRSQAVTLVMDNLEPETIHNLVMYLDDGSNYIYQLLGGQLTPKGPPTLADFRQSGDCHHEDWLPYILPFALGVPEQFVFQQLGLVIEEFLDRSRLWREYVEIPVIADQEGYVIPLATGRQIVQFEANPSIDGAQYFALDESPFVRTTVPRGFLRDENRIVFSPAPRAAGVARLFISFKPTFESRVCPKFLFSDWRDAIADGVLARLLNMVGPKDAPYEWSNPVEAEMRNNKFITACARGSANRRNLGDGASPKASGMPFGRRPRGVDHRAFY